MTSSTDTTQGMKNPDPILITSPFTSTSTVMAGKDTHNILKMKRYLENEENYEDEFRILNQLFVDAGASV